MRTAFPQYFQEAERRLNSELWHACAGPLVSLPSVGSLVVYFPQGHSEQIAALTKEGVDARIPNYPNLPPQLFCQLHNITLQADGETDEVYAQMTLQPLNPHEQKESYLASNLSTPGRQPINYFCKTLTASDTSTHGGFSIPRRAAEKVFPRLDFSQQPPVQELVAKDLHDNEWKFRHIYRGQPKRHLLTTGWSVFVNAKRLVSGDSVVFVRNEKGHLLLGIRRANRTHPVMASSVLSSDTMHIGVLAAAAHAASTNCRFSIFYNPRASPSEFVVPITKYENSVRRMQVSVGMRFEMLFETEESTVRRHIGTIIGIGDFDPVHWPNSQWRSIKVGWDVSAVGERQQWVSMWEIEPLTTFLMYPPPYPLELKRPWSQIQGISSLYGNDGNIRMPFVSIKRDNGEQNLQTLSFQGMGMDPWMRILDGYESSVSGMQLDIYQGMAEAALQETRNVVDPCKQLKFQQQPPNQLQQQELNLQQQQPVNHLMQQRLQKQASQHRLMQEQLQKSFNEQQQPSFHQQDQQTPFQQHHHQQQTFQVSDVAGSLPQFPLSKSQSSISLHSVCSQPVIVNTSANPASQTTSSSKSSLHCIFGFLTSERGSQYLNLATPSQPVVQQPAENLTWPCVPQGQQLPASWFSVNRILNDPVPCLPAGQVEVPLSSGSQSVLPRLEHADQSNIPTQLCHFTLADCFSEQEREQSDSQCNLLFGVNIDIPSLVSPDTVPNSRNVGNGAYVASSFSDLLNVSPCASGSGFALNSDIGTSGSKGESGFLQHSAKFTKMTRTFTKVYKLGSVGRSLDVTRFNGYPGLRAELDHMFELEGQLKDPQRSGWQLVFVDKEKDVLLLGDGPWEEFVNNVQFIKILSPPEVLQMNREGIRLLSSIPSQRQTSNCSEDCVPRHDFRNRYSVITSAGALES